MTTTKQPPKLVMPYGLMYARDLTDAQKVTAMWILSFANKGKSGTCWASNQTIAALAGKSQRQVSRDIAALCSAGYMVALDQEEKVFTGKMYSKNRHLTLDKKVFMAPKAVEEKLNEEESAQPEIDAVALECPGTLDMDVYLYKNYELHTNKTKKILNIADAYATAAPGVFSFKRTFAIGYKTGFVVEPQFSRKQTSGFYIYDTGVFYVPSKPTHVTTFNPSLPHTAKVESAPAGSAAPPAPVAPPAAPPAAQILARVKKLGLNPRQLRVIGGMIHRGVAPGDIILSGGLVMTRSDITMKDKLTMPTDSTLAELLRRSDEGVLLRQSRAKKAGKPTVAVLSERLRAFTSKLQFVATHTQRELGQLKQFSKVMEQAGIDPLEAIDRIGQDWAGFGYHQAYMGKMKPKSAIPDPGSIAYYAGDIANWIRDKKGKPAPQPVKQGSFSIGVPPAPAQESVAAPGKGHTSGETQEQFLERLRQLGLNTDI